MSHRVDGPERRSFVFHEVPQLRSDFDPVIQPGQESAANRLLGRDGQEQNTDERTRASVSQHQFHPNDSFVYSDDGQSRCLPPDETTNKHLAQVGAHSVPFSEKTKEPIYWKGNTPWALTWEFLGIVVSICFLILGAFVVHLKDQQESDWSIKVLSATRIAPTLWPIFFSGVLGNAIRALADWRVERGIDLLALEQLMGSLTLAGSVITVFKWSILRISSIALLVLWAFNPLGSQSSFRGIYLRDREGSRPGNIAYYNHNISQQVQLNSMFNTATRIMPRIRALYSSALYDIASATQYVDKTNATYQDIIITLGGESSAGIQAATDPWGNVRMPSLHALSGFDANEPHRWVNVPWQDSVHNYSSLVGEHVAGLGRNFTGNTKFNTTASYLTFSCSPWLNINGMDESHEWIMNKFQKNLSSLLEPTGTQGMNNFFLEFSEKQVWNDTTQSHDIVFVTRRDPPAYLSVTQCSPQMIYVDAQVSCISKGALGKTDCGVDAVRETLTTTNPKNLTIFEPRTYRWPNSTLDLDPRMAPDLMHIFMDLLDDNKRGSGTSGIVEWYLKDPLTAVNNPSSVGYANLDEVDIKVFEQRFSLLWNTLWKTNIQHATIMGGDLTPSTFNDTSLHLNTTSAIVFPLPATYALDIPWIILYFVSVAIMFFAAVFSLIMHERCHAPRILGYVSSQIRDSRYFHDREIQGNSAADGTGMTRRLGHLKVMIADTKTDEDVGKIAFVPAHAESRVRRRRWYQ
ncbi:hypothetical protein AA0117_g12232 [Alternaria alternata]|uniref:DUF3176 domain-containing protein n=1 Tax=Alternaria alternata TaxID=5599 RepID=A0A4Q4MZW2_ALTAL|nr:hypothetical protein AA0117_g12232 [Alternaria alternata]